MIAPRAADHKAPHDDEAHGHCHGTKCSLRSAPIDLRDAPALDLMAPTSSGTELHLLFSYFVFLSPALPLRGRSLLLLVPHPRIRTSAALGP
jgi:hypothetical protein